MTTDRKDSLAMAIDLRDLTHTYRGAKQLVETGQNPALALLEYAVRIISSADQVSQGEKLDILDQEMAKLDHLQQQNITKEQRWVIQEAAMILTADNLSHFAPPEGLPTRGLIEKLDQSLCKVPLFDVGINTRRAGMPPKRRGLILPR